MLGKLMKYELKAFGRIMLPLYGALLVVTVVFATSIRLSMNTVAKTIMDRFAIIGGFLFVGVMVAIMVMMVVLIVQRFYRGLLGTEGYLMFTLPATTLEHILSKALSAFVWLILGAVTGTISGFIMISITGDLHEFFEELRNLLRSINAEDAFVRNLLLLLLCILIGLMASIFKVYAALAIGHQWGSHRLLGAVLAYIGIGFLEVMVTALLGKTGLFDASRMTDSFNSAVTMALCISIIQILLYGTVSWALLDRKLNLE